MLLQFTGFDLQLRDDTVKVGSGVSRNLKKKRKDIKYNNQKPLAYCSHFAAFDLLLKGKPNRGLCHDVVLFIMLLTIGLATFLLVLRKSPCDFNA